MTAYPAFRDAVADAHPRLAIVLGSGLRDVSREVTVVAHVSYSQVPGLVPPTTPGHEGQLVLGYFAGVPILMALGRVHYYEGHPWDRVTRLIRLFQEWGMTAVVLTNAAGGIRSDLRPGSFMLIESHLKLLSPDAWRTASYPHHPYSQRLLQQFRHHAHDFNPPMAVGCYAAVTGPSYETAAEIRALRAIGADAVGMSTAIEAEVAAEVGLEVAAISCITNWAAGLSVQPLSHSEVEVTARQAVNRMTELLRHFVPAI